MKIKKSEIFFYMSYCLLYISLFMGDIYFTNGLDIVAKYMRICAYGLIILSCVNIKLQLNKFIQLLGILLVTLSYGIITGDLYWSILTLLIYSSNNVDIKNIFRISSKIMGCGIIVVPTLCAAEIIPDVITIRNTVIVDGINRHSFGFYHSNVLPLLIFYLEIYYICLNKEKIKFIKILGFTLVSLIVNLYCRSRNAIILTVMLLIFLLIQKSRKNVKNHEIMYSIAKFCVPVMTIFSYAMTFLLLKGGIWSIIDSFFSGRFRLAIFKIRRIGLHLINIMSNESFLNDNTTYANGQVLNTVVLDNGYLYVGLRYGIIILLFYFAVSYLLSKKSISNSYLLGALIAVFVANFVDNDLVDYSFLPFILWAFNDFKLKKVISDTKAKGKNRLWGQKNTK